MEQGAKPQSPAALPLTSWSRGVQSTPGWSQYRAPKEQGCRLPRRPAPAGPGGSCLLSTAPSGCCCGHTPCRGRWSHDHPMPREQGPALAGHTRGSSHACPAHPTPGTQRGQEMDAAGSWRWGGKVELEQMRATDGARRPHPSWAVHPGISRAKLLETRPELTPCWGAGAAPCTRVPLPSRAPSSPAGSQETPPASSEKRNRKRQGGGTLRGGARARPTPPYRPQLPPPRRAQCYQGSAPRPSPSSMRPAPRCTAGGSEPLSRPLVSLSLSFSQLDKSPAGEGE